VFSTHHPKAGWLSAIGLTLAALSFSAVSASAATLSTGLTANNGQRGIMFNISTGTDALMLEGIQTDFYAGTTSDYEIYYTIGDYAAVQNTPTAWTLHDSISGFTGVSGLQSWDIVDLFLPKNKTIGLYITNTSGGGIRYRNASTLGAQLATDGALTIFGGVGRSYAFGNTYTQRDFVGALDYSIAPVPLPAGLPLLLAGLGVIGLAARQRRTAAV
jgi:hypothetical protein